MGFCHAFELYCCISLQLQPFSQLDSNSGSPVETLQFQSQAHPTREPSGFLSNNTGFETCKLFALKLALLYLKPSQLFKFKHQKAFLIRSKPSRKSLRTEPPPALSLLPALSLDSSREHKPPVLTSVPAQVSPNGPLRPKPARTFKAAYWNRRMFP